MKTLSKTLTAASAAIVLSVLATTSQAGSTEALAACKSQIEQDQRMSAYSSMSSKVDKMRKRGRYTTYHIDVSAESADGQISAWKAQCKARDSGRVEALELAQEGRTDDMEIAQTGK